MPTRADTSRSWRQLLHIDGEYSGTDATFAKRPHHNRISPKAGSADDAVARSVLYILDAGDVPSGGAGLSGSEQRRHDSRKSDVEHGDRADQHARRYRHDHRVVKDGAASRPRHPAVFALRFAKPKPRRRTTPTRLHAPRVGPGASCYFPIMGSGICDEVRELPTSLPIGRSPRPDQP